MKTRVIALLRVPEMFVLVLVTREWQEAVEASLPVLQEQQMETLR